MEISPPAHPSFLTSVRFSLNTCPIQYYHHSPYPIVYFLHSLMVWLFNTLSNLNKKIAVTYF